MSNPFDTWVHVNLRYPRVRFYTYEERRNIDRYEGVPDVHDAVGGDVEVPDGFGVYRVNNVIEFCVGGL